MPPFHAVKHAHTVKISTHTAVSQRETQNTYKNWSQPPHQIDGAVLNSLASLMSAMALTSTLKWCLHLGLRHRYLRIVSLTPGSSLMTWGVEQEIALCLHLGHFIHSPSCHPRDTCILGSGRYYLALLASVAARAACAILPLSALAVSLCGELLA